MQDELTLAQRIRVHAQVYGGVSMYLDRSDAMSLVQLMEGHEEIEKKLEAVLANNHVIRLAQIKAAKRESFIQMAAMFFYALAITVLL